MPPTFIFRCDATMRGGSGHVMRCLTLAETVANRGLQVLFVCESESLQVVPALARSRFQVFETSSEISDAVALIASFVTKADILIIDSYDIGLEFESLCRPLVRGVLVVDDLADRVRDCDWLVNGAPEVSIEAYASYVPASARLLLGTQYALVHPAFLAQRERSLARRTACPSVKKILIAFGGTDPANGTSLALDALSFLSDIKIDVALGASSPNLTEVKQRVEKLGAFLHIDTPDMPTLVRDADLAIGAGGTSTWERCALGLPSIIVTIASNQTRIAQAVAHAGAAIDLGAYADVDVRHLREQITRLIDDPDCRSAMTHSAALLIDGLGTARVLDEVLG